MFSRIFLFYVQYFSMGSKPVANQLTHTREVPKNRLFPHNFTHSLCVHTHRKHIRRPEPLQLIPPLAQVLQVPGQGGGIAAHVHDPLRGHLHHGVKHLGLAALAGRVDHHHIRPDPFPLILLRQHFLRLSHEKFRIGDAVQGGVFPGVLYGLRHDLHSVHLPRLSGQKQGDGADAAVKIPDCLFSLQGRVLQGRIVKPFRLDGIHLVEGAGGDLVGHIPDLILDEGPAPQPEGLLSHNHVGILPVHVDHDAGHAGNGGKPFCQFLSCRQFSAV